MNELRYIIVTGASRGIGFATARSFADLTDCKVLAIARSKDGLARLKRDCQDLPGQLECLEADLSDPGDIVRLCEVILEMTPQIDVLVNNAGALVFKDFEDLSSNDFDLMYKVNLRAPFLLIQGLLPKMKKGTHIINISSMGGVQGSLKFKGLSAYSATKGGLSILTEALADEFSDRGIRVNCLAPGSVQTEMLAQAFPDFKAPVQPRQMGEFIREFALKGGALFNGKILPVSLSTP